MDFIKPDFEALLDGLLMSCADQTILINNHDCFLTLLNAIIETDLSEINSLMNTAAKDQTPKRTLPEIVELKIFN